MAAALAAADVVLVENLLSIPLNPAASAVTARVLHGRPAVLHHHDPPWQRPRFATVTDLPVDDGCWRHVTINRLTEQQFAARGLAATTIYNGFDVNQPTGDRATCRAALDIADEPLVVHPVRAIARKNIPAALRIAERLEATYLLTGPAEEGFGPERSRLLDAARCRVVPSSRCRVAPGYGRMGAMTGHVDPVLARRAQVANWVSKGIRLGSALYVVASVVFFVGIMTGFTHVMVAMIVGLMIAGSVLLAPAIVFKYAVKAADRADRDDSW